MPKKCYTDPSGYTYKPVDWDARPSADCTMHGGYRGGFINWSSHDNYYFWASAYYGSNAITTTSYSEYMSTGSFELNLNKEPEGTKNPQGQGGSELKLHSTNSLIKDGHWKQFGMTHKMEAGYHVRVVVENKNPFGVQLSLEDQSHYHIDNWWTGREYSGDSYIFILLPLQTKTFDFYMFDHIPMTWQFFLDSSVSDAVNVNVKFFSDWSPNDKIDP